MIRFIILGLLSLTLYGCGSSEYVKASYAKQTMSLQQAYKHCKFAANDDTRVLTYQYGKNFQMAWRRAYEKCMYEQGYIED